MEVGKEGEIRTTSTDVWLQKQPSCTWLVWWLISVSCPALFLCHTHTFHNSTTVQFLTALCYWLFILFTPHTQVLGELFQNLSFKCAFILVVLSEVYTVQILDFALCIPLQLKWSLLSHSFDCWPAVMTLVQAFCFMAAMWPWSHLHIQYNILFWIFIFCSSCWKHNNQIFILLCCFK